MELATANRVRCQQAVVDVLPKGGVAHAEATSLRDRFAQLVGSADAERQRARAALDEINALPPWRLYQ
jgi:hypothetical protein